MKEPSSFFFFAGFSTLFLGIFYFTVTNIAGLYIVSDLGGSPEISVYPMVFYGLGNCVSIPLSKYFLDCFGPSRMIIASLLVYTFFSILCGFAGNFFLFNICRFGLGLGAGPFYLFCNRIIVKYAPLEKKELYLTISMLLYAVTPVVGASFGAWLAYENFWRWIFHVNEPAALFLAIYFWQVFRHLSPLPTIKKPFDWVGFLFYSLGIVSIVIALTLSQQIDWMRSSLFVWLLTLGIPALVFSIVWQLYHPFPLFEFRLLKNPTFSYTLFNLGMLFSAYFGVIILISLWLNIYVNYTPLWIAALLGSMAVAGMLGFFFSRLWMKIIDARIPLGIAILLFFISCIYSAHFNVDINFFRIALARFLAGFGLVMFLIPLFHLFQCSCTVAQSSAGFTLFQTVRALSSSLGAALYVILWQRRQVFFHERLGEALTPSAPLTQSYFQSAEKIFGLTPDQASEELNVILDTAATSLGLNDTFGMMAYVLGGLFLILVGSFFIKKLHAGIRSAVKTSMD